MNTRVVFTLELNMGLNLEWFDEDKSIIYVQLTGKIKGTDFLDAVPAFLSMLQSVTHPVDVICDQRQQFNFTSDYLEVARKVHKVRYPNLRLVVFLGKNLAWELFLVFVGQFKWIPYQFAQAATVADARVLIEHTREQDSDLPPPSSLHLN